MSVSVTLTVSPAAPVHGAVVTATYVVSGNSGAGTPVSITGEATVGASSFPVSVSFTMPGAAAAAVTYAVPACPGLTFTATANPAAFTAVVP